MSLISALFTRSMAFLTQCRISLQAYCPLFSFSSCSGLLKWLIRDSALIISSTFELAVLTDLSSHLTPSLNFVMVVCGGRPDLHYVGFSLLAVFRCILKSSEDLLSSIRVFHAFSLVKYISNLESLDLDLRGKINRSEKNSKWMSSHYQITNKNEHFNTYCHPSYITYYLESYVFQSFSTTVLSLQKKLKCHFSSHVVAMVVCKRSCDP